MICPESQDLERTQRFDPEPDPLPNDSIFPLVCLHGIDIFVSYIIEFNNTQYQSLVGELCLRYTDKTISVLISNVHVNVYSYRPAAGRDKHIWASLSQKKHLAHGTVGYI